MICGISFFTKWLVSWLVGWLVGLFMEGLVVWDGHIEIGIRKVWRRLGWGGFFLCKGKSLIHFYLCALTAFSSCPNGGVWSGLVWSDLIWPGLIWSGLVGLV